MIIIAVIVGSALLFFGRKLFWLFVAAAGFAVGFTYGPLLFHGESPGMTLLIALAAGLIGALLGLFLKGLAIAVGGFMAGGYAAVEISRVLQTYPGPDVRLVYLLGGIIGAVVLFLIFDWALIVLSSLLGAAVIVHSIILRGPWEFLLLVVLTLLGVLSQAEILRRERYFRP